LLIPRALAGQTLDGAVAGAAAAAKRAVSGAVSETEPEPDSDALAQPVDRPNPIEEDEVEEVPADKILELCDVIGGRSLLMTGFVQHALARYTYIPDGSDDDDESLHLNRIFWLATHAACGCLMVCVLLTSELSIALHQLDTAESRYAFAEKTRWLWRWCQRAKTIGMHFLFISAGLMGWGCSQKCADPAVPNGTCYSRLSAAPVATCGFGLLMVVFFRATTHVAFMHARRVGEQKAQKNFTVAKKELDTERVSMTFTNGSMKVVNLVGNSATICAGFVIYNIATFDTDVLHGPITARAILV